MMHNWPKTFQTWLKINLQVHFFVHVHVHKHEQSKVIDICCACIAEYFLATTDILCIGIVHIIISLDSAVVAIRLYRQTYWNWVTFFVCWYSLTRGCCTFIYFFGNDFRCLFDSFDCVVNLKLRSRTVLLYLRNIFLV